MIADPADIYGGSGGGPPVVRAAAYLRRSTDKQEQSLADQRIEVQRWSSARGFTLVNEYVDDAISGTSAKKRPGFMAMIEAAERREFDAIVVWASDRFSRGDVTETEHYRYRLREVDVTVHSVTEDFVSKEGLEGTILRAVRQNANHEYSVGLSRNTVRGQISSVLKYSDPGRMPPYGYDREILGPTGEVIYRVRFHESGQRETFASDGRTIGTYAKGQSLDKPGKECTARLVLSTPERVEVVKDIFTWCVEGRGFKNIADELNRRGVISPRGSLWQHTTIKALIANPAYKGDIVWNRRSEAKFYVAKGKSIGSLRSMRDSGTVRMVHKDDWIVMPGGTPPLVDLDTWEAAQRAASGRSSQVGGRAKQHDRWLLSGVLKCDCCGSPFWGLNKRKGRAHGKKEIVTPYYICAGRCRSGKSVCPVSIHIRADEFERQVLGELTRLMLGDAAGLDEAVEQFVRGVLGNDSVRGAEEERGAIRRELKSIDTKVEMLLSGIDPANLPLVNQTLSRLRARKEELQAQFRQLEAEEHGATAANGRPTAASLRAFAKERIGLLQEAAAGRRDSEARSLMAAYIDEIRINPEERSAVMVVNANALLASSPHTLTARPPSPATSHPWPDDATSCVTATSPPCAPQKPNDRPSNESRSQVAVIEDRQRGSNGAPPLTPVAARIGGTGASHPLRSCDRM